MQLTTFFWMIGGVLAVPFAGPLSDRFGRKPILLAGVFALGVGSVIAALSHSFLLFLIGRFCQGLSTAPMLIAGYASINEYFRETLAIRWMARVSALSILSPGLGPAFGGLWIEHFSWQGLFGLLAILTFINGILLVRYMPETISIKERSVLHVGSILRGYGALLTDSQFMLRVCQTFAPRFGSVVWVLASVFILIDVYHVSTVVYGWLLGITFSCVIIGNLIVNYFSSVTMNKLLIWLARACIALGALLAAIIAWWAPKQLSVLLSAFGLFFVGVGVNEPIMIRMSLNLKNGQMGLKTTVLTFMRMMVDSFAALVMVLFYNGSVKSVALCLLLSAGIMQLLWLIPKKIKPRVGHA